MNNGEKSKLVYTIVKNGCPQCGSDLEKTQVSETCVNFQHPSFPEIYHRGGKRNCSYALWAG